MSYIGYIPAPIRHDANLSPRDKLLYCEITACLDDSGICTKNNVYFAKMSGCSKSTISASMTKLRELGYIAIIIEKDQDTKKFKKRYVIPKAMSSFSVGGNEELQKAMSSFSVGVGGVSGGVSEGGESKTMSNICEPITINSNIIYSLSPSKGNPINYIRHINNRQLEFLKKIVTNFYNSKHKQYPNHIKANWFEDNNLTKGSVNTLFELITKDGWNEKEVRDVIKWATDDKFWASNLMSLRTLRTKSKNGMTKFANLHLKFNN